MFVEQCSPCWGAELIRALVLPTWPALSAAGEVQRARGVGSPLGTRRRRSRLSGHGRAAFGHGQLAVASFGRRAARRQGWHLGTACPDGYLQRVRRENPDLDDLVELYLAEALQSFNAHCYLATSVVLGVAAERAFLAMADSYASSSMAGASAMAKELAKPRSNYFALWTEFRKRIEPVRQTLPGGLADALTLDAIADLIRLTRNEVGHPTGRQIDEDTARSRRRSRSSSRGSLRMGCRSMCRERCVEHATISLPTTL